MSKWREINCWTHLCAVAFVAVCAAGPVAFAGSYRDFAVELVANLPGEARFRPDLEAELAALANHYRVGEGINSLQSSDEFSLAARAQAADMMRNNFSGHRSSSGVGFEGRMRAIGGKIERFGTIGENVARDSRKTPADARKAAALFQQWIDSRPHRFNLRKAGYAFVSTGVVQKGNTIWAVQIFWGTPRERGLFQ